MRLLVALLFPFVAMGQYVATVPATSTGGGGGCGNHNTTFTRLQHTSVDQPSSVASQNLAYTSNVACNSLLVVAVRGSSVGVTSLTVTDTIGNTWTNGTIQIVASNSSLQISWTVNTTDGADTVTVTPNTSSSLRICIIEYSGVNTSTPLDAQNNSTNGSSTSPHASNITPGTTNELVIGATAITAAETYTAGTNFTLVDQVPSGAGLGKLGVEEWIQTTATTTNAPGTLGASSGWSGAIAVFKHG